MTTLSAYYRVRPSMPGETDDFTFRVGPFIVERRGVVDVPSGPFAWLGFGVESVPSWIVVNPRVHRPEQAAEVIREDLEALARAAQTRSLQAEWRKARYFNGEVDFTLTEIKPPLITGAIHPESTVNAHRPDTLD